MKEYLYNLILVVFCFVLFFCLIPVHIGSTVCALGPSSPPILEAGLEPGVRVLVCVRLHDNSGEHSNFYGLCKLGQSE